MCNGCNEEAIGRESRLVLASFRIKANGDLKSSKCKEESRPSLRCELWDGDEKGLVCASSFLSVSDEDLSEDHEKT